MGKAELRITYSGLIIFAAQLISVVTGLVFILLLTRNMTQSEYGIWGNIFDVTGYFMVCSGFIPFWAVRFVARGEKGATKTAFVSSFILAIGTAAVYIPLAPIIATSLGISQTNVYVLASGQMVMVFLVSTLESCLRATRPQAVGFGLLLEEAVKLCAAYVLIVRLHQLFIGAMLSLILAAVVQTLFYVRLLSDEFKEKVRWSYFREWLKGSTALIYNAAGNQIANLIPLFLLIYGSEAGRGDYLAATTFATIIGYSSSVAFALYPKMLAQDSLKEIAKSLKTVMMFALPMVAIVMSLSKSLLTVLNVSYSEAWPVLIVLSIDALVALILAFYTNVVYGVEKLDEEAKIPIRQLAKSRMFKMLSLQYIQAALTLPTAWFVLTRFAAGEGARVTAATYVAIIVLIAHIILLLIAYLIMRGCVAISVPWKSIGKYASISAITAAFLYLIPHPQTLALTFAAVLAGVIVYGIILLASDNDARQLVRSILKEIKSLFEETH